MEIGGGHVRKEKGKGPVSIPGKRVGNSVGNALGGDWVKTLVFGAWVPRKKETLDTEKQQFCFSGQNEQ